MQKILIVEDDPQILKSLRLNLKLSGYETEVASTCQDAWTSFRSIHFDLICLDIGLPDGSGLDLCEKIRSSGSEIPILFISALTEEATVVKAISRGGDDYVRKPFGMEELKVRMQKIMRKLPSPSNLLNFGPLSIDSAKRVVTFMGEIVNVGRKELEILKILVKKSGDIVTRESILEALYENADAYDRTIDSHMSHLRKKLREVAGSNVQIVSVYGMGYRLEMK